MSWKSAKGEPVCRTEEPERCPRYGQPMRMITEGPTHWHFVCPTCLNSTVAAKVYVGGTLGAGDWKPDGTRSTGKGFG